MEKNRSWNCCLQIILGCGVLSVCIGLPLLLGSLWLGKEIYTAAIATPTEIHSCKALLNVMLHDFSKPKAERVEVDSMQDLVIYQVSGDKLSDPQVIDVPEKLLAMQQDSESQYQIWEYFTRIIPRDKRTKVTEYKITTDGTDKINAQAFIEYTVYSDSTTDSTTEKWALDVDLADYASNRQFTSTLLHEFGHMLTLNISQIDYRVKADTCGEFFRDPGCSRTDSYLQKFYDSFWNEIQDEWQKSVSESSPEEIKFGLNKYFDAHPNDFVSLYATTSAVEDIAESWMHFVLSPRPVGNTVAEKKILFFYDYPELVTLRSDIDNRICDYYNLPTDS